MHLELMRETRRDRPQLANPEAVRTARIWHCKFRSLDFLSQLENLEGLAVATFPDSSFKALGSLRQLKYFSVVHLPKVSDLGPLASMKSLEVLSLSTLPSWDSSGKTTEVATLEPLASLPRLRHVELFGVVAADRSLAPIEGCPVLESLRVSKWPKPEIARFRRATRMSDDWAPRPWFLPE